MYILNIARVIQKMPVNEIRAFLFENYYKQIGFSKDNYRSMKCLKKKISCCFKQINRKNT